MPRCGLVTSDPTTELAIWKRYETQAEAEYMEDASVLQLVRRWKGTPGYLTKLTADEMRLQLVEPSWRSCLRGRKMAKNDFCLHEMSVLAAKFVKQPEGTGDVLEITWVGGTKHKAKVLLGRDSFLPRLDYEDGWNCRCVIWPTTKTGGLVYHFLDPKASLESEKTSMEYTLVRKSVNVRGRAQSEVEGVAETRRRLKAQLQELKQTCGHGRERLPPPLRVVVPPPPPPKIFSLFSLPKRRSPPSPYGKNGKREVRIFSRELPGDGRTSRLSDGNDGHLAKGPRTFGF